MRIHKVLLFSLFYLLFVEGAFAQKYGWKEFETPVEVSLRGLSAVSDDVIWASGSGGVWLKSEDGGQNWDHGIIDGLDSVDFRSIHAFDKSNAVSASAGQPAVIYRTSDGGNSWQRVLTLSKEAFLDGISFSDPLNGFVFGDPVNGEWMIYKTHDAGFTWEKLENTPEVIKGEAGFAASGSSMVATGNILWIGSGGTQSNLWFSYDLGDTWEKKPSPLSQGQPSQGIFSTCFISPELVVAVGGDYLKPEETEGTLGIFSVSNGKWISGVSELYGYRSGVEYLIKRDLLIAVGPSGSDYSLDIGKTWSNFSSSGFHAVRTTKNGSVLWASGSDGRIAKLIEY